MTDRELIKRVEEQKAGRGDPLSPEELAAQRELRGFLSQFRDQAAAHEAGEADRKRLIAIFGDTDENETWFAKASRSCTVGVL